jgi:hypothetical protein
MKTGAGDYRARVSGRTFAVAIYMLNNWAISNLIIHPKQYFFFLITWDTVHTQLPVQGAVSLPFR